ncbi:MAG: outer membrane protein assembly factor BamE [Gammaproteobacteria bacterium]|nr:outer membrane protein assembly factor BamE [Gammaproteobacteria bacterium]MCD8542675.1 outer membrane protein assembly factor BamE [Gammaproteobacteria bacterium]
MVYLFIQDRRAMKYIASLSVLTAMLALAACKPYEMDIPQGKILTEQQLAKINIGMSRETVLNILGSPLPEASPYDPHRLDYIATMQKNGGEITEKRLSIYFRNNHVAKIVQENEIVTP